MRTNASRVVVIATLLMVGASSRSNAQPRLGKPAPEIDLPTLNSGRVTLSKMRGHPVVVSFWGTWCAPCRAEFPLLVSAHLKNSEAGLYVLAVNGRDQERSTADVQRFVETFTVPFTIALDKRGSVRRRYRLEAQPMTVFIDAGGIVRMVHSGLISAEELDRGIAMILPQPPAVVSELPPLS
jgi:cytochrome c biogenesis protein CcmG, thiol:disulfide interchange protein DsbE